MDSQLTPEQKRQLDSWAAQRDSILRDIGEKKTESEKLTVTNVQLAASNTEISNKIQQSIGRLEELDKQEAKRTAFTTLENANLNVEKSILQTEVSSLKSEISSLSTIKEGLKSDIESVTKVHEAVFSRASEIERIVGETVKLNSTNASEIKTILGDAGIELKKIIDIGRENVEVTNQAILKLPKIVVDLHRNVIERQKIPRAKIQP